MESTLLRRRYHKTKNKLSAQAISIAFKARHGIATCMSSRAQNAAPSYCHAALHSHHSSQASNLTLKKTCCSRSKRTCRPHTGICRRNRRSCIWSSRYRRPSPSQRTQGSHRWSSHLGSSRSLRRRMCLVRKGTCRCLRRSCLTYHSADVFLHFHMHHLHLVFSVPGTFVMPLLPVFNPAKCLASLCTSNTCFWPTS